MAAVIEIDEVNGAGLVLHHGILHSAFGSLDAFELDPVANKIALSSNSFEKWQRVHLVDLVDSSAISTIRYWSGTARPSGDTYAFNGSTSQAIYDGSKKTSAEQPGTGATKALYLVPTSQPVTANIGIGGSLTGSLTAPGSSDYIVAQQRLDGTVIESADPIINFDLFEIA